MIEKISLFIYNLATNVYYISIYLTSLWNKKAALWIEGRKKLLQRIENEIKSNENLVWVHCSSLGEFEQGKLVIEAIKSTFPKYKILLTFFSPSGYEQRKSYSYADYIYYLPLDSKRNAKKFIQLVNPKIAIFLKYDFWYYYLYYLKINKIPLFLISAIFSKEQIFFKKYGSLYNKMLGFFTHFFVQDDSSQNLLEQFGFKNVSVTPDTRIDRVCQIYDNIKNNRLDIIEKFKKNDLLLIAGSSYETEEKYIFNFIKTVNFNGKIILVPHNIDRSHINNILRIFGKQAALFSDIQDKNSEIIEDILIIDKIGLLGSMYQYADIAFIGGGFNNGIHNTLEPAVFGLPVIMGPKNINKFKESRNFVRMKGGFVVHNYDDFERTMEQLLKEKIRKNAGKICRNYIIENQGGTQKIIDFLKTSL